MGKLYNENFRKEEIVMARRILWISVLFLTVFLFGFGVNSIWAEYPERGVRFIACFSPGGGSDLTARALTRYANPYLDKRLYVDNVTGAAGAIGSREGAKAAPDGHTLTLIATMNTVGPHVRKGFPSYDLFDPICIVIQEPMTLAVKMDSRFKTVNDLISYAKAHPGQVSVSTAGVGTVNHLEIEAFASAIGAKFNLVPYKGSKPALVAAAGGHVDVATTGCAAALSLIKGKKLRPLIVFGAKRSPLYQDVPTAKELGYELVIYMWRGIGVPKGTPNEIKEVLAEAFRKAVENEDYKKWVDQLGLERIFLGPDKAIFYLRTQYDFFKGVAEKIGLEPK